MAVGVLVVHTNNSYDFNICHHLLTNHWQYLPVSVFTRFGLRFFNNGSFFFRFNSRDGRNLFISQSVLKVHNNSR